LTIPALFILAIGLAIGSFLNVCVYRIPRGESLLYPASHCPICQTPIKWYDNIPVISYLLLRGRCRKCSSPISLRYPLIEVLTGLLFLLTFYFSLSSLSLSSFLLFIKNLLFISLLIPILFIDLKEQIVPNRFSYTLLAGGLIFGFLTRFFLPAVLGAGIGAGLFLIILLLGSLFLKEAGMGMGDVKLAAGIGAFLGWKLALLCFFLSFLLGAVIATILLATHLKGRRDRIPFAPFLVGAGFICLFLGANLIDFYFSLAW